jgi:hypothetical protein
MIWLVIGHVIWGIAFVVLYAMLSIGCEYGWHQITAFAGLSVQRIMLVVLYLVSLAAAGATVYLAWLRWAAARQASGRIAPTGFLEWAGYLSSLAALAATVASFVPVFFLTSCY